MNKETAPPPRAIRVDLQRVADMVAPDSRVLDVGAGDGALLAYLVHYKGVDGRGIEIDRGNVTACVSHGLSVIQGDAETDLKDYPADAFDYVILSQTLQAMRDVRGALEQLLRIGRRAVVSFNNFGHWRVRWNMLCRGRMPITNALPHRWYDTPNIHLCSIADFLSLCDEMGIHIEQSIALDAAGRQLPTGSRFVNARAEQAVFLLSRRASAAASNPTTANGRRG
jgi:methionine biosynthesis protein MetW